MESLSSPLIELIDSGLFSKEQLLIIGNKYKDFLIWKSVFLTEKLTPEEMLSVASTFNQKNLFRTLFETKKLSTEQLLSVVKKQENWELYPDAIRTGKISPSYLLKKLSEKKHTSCHWMIFITVLQLKLLTSNDLLQIAKNRLSDYDLTKTLIRSGILSGSQKIELGNLVNSERVWKKIDKYTNYTELSIREILHLIQKTGETHISSLCFSDIVNKKEKEGKTYKFFQRFNAQELEQLVEVVKSPSEKSFIISMGPEKFSPEKVFEIGKKQNNEEFWREVLSCIDLTPLHSHQLTEWIISSRSYVVCQQIVRSKQLIFEDKISLLKTVESEKTVEIIFKSFEKDDLNETQKKIGDEEASRAFLRFKKAA